MVIRNDSFGPSATPRPHSNENEGTGMSKLRKHGSVLLLLGAFGTGVAGCAKKTPAPEPAPEATPHAQTPPGDGLAPPGTAFVNSAAPEVEPPLQPKAPPPGAAPDAGVNKPEGQDRTPQQ